MRAMADDEDVYVAQLREVFDSCDLTEKGYLNRDEVIDLCQKLQLDDQIPALLKQCIGDEDKDGKVDFEQFKEAFVSVLSQAIDSLAEATEEDRSELSEFDPASEPLRTFNDKKYGRRSRPLPHSASSDGNLFSEENGDRPDGKTSEIPKSSKRAKRSNSMAGIKRRPSLRRTHSSSLPGALRKRLSSTGKGALGQEEVLEGSGSMNYSFSGINSNSPEDISPEDADQLRAIWDEVAVGVSGYLDMKELSIVCEHIGMGSIDEKELDLLFKELDVNRDGLVSFDEFLNGLFMATKQQIRKDPEIESLIIPLLDHKNVEMTSTPKPRKMSATSISSPRQMISKTGEESSRSLRIGKKIDSLSFLDFDQSGWTKVEDLEEYFNSQGLADLTPLLTNVVPDAEGRINLKELTKAMEALVHERGGVSQSVLRTYKHEIHYLRGKVDSIASERDQLKENVNKVGFDNTTLIEESEEQTRVIEEQYERKIALQEQYHVEKLQQNNQDWNKERLQLNTTFQMEKSDLEEQVEQSKYEEIKMKEKLVEAEAEIVRLDSTLKETLSDLTEEEKKSLRLEKELESVANLQQRFAELEASRELLREQYEDQGNTLRELQRINKGVRDLNDELQMQIENLKAELNMMGKKRPTRRRHHDQSDRSESRRDKTRHSHREATTKVNRMGSYLSDYLKPQIIKRNEDGETTEEEDELSFDAEEGKALNGEKETVNLKAKIKEQESIIDQLRQDLQSTHRMLDGDVGEAARKHENDVQKIREKFTLEIEEIQSNFAIEKNEIAADFKVKLSELEAMKENLDTEKKKIADNYETKIVTLEKEFELEKDAIINGFTLDKEELITYSNSDKLETQEAFKSEKKKIANLFKQDKEEIEMNYRGQITKLEEQIVILETEKAEMELRFVNEKAEMEQQFRLRLSELEERFANSNREFDRSQKHVELVKEGLLKKHKNEKQDMEKKFRIEIETLEEEIEIKIQVLTKEYKNEISEHKNEISEHKNEISELKNEIFELKKNVNEQLSEAENSYNNEISSMRDSYNREKSELEDRSAREKAALRDTLKQEHQHKFNVEVAEVRMIALQDKKDLEKKFNNEKHQINTDSQQDRTEFENCLNSVKVDMEVIRESEKAEMELKFVNEKAEMEQQFRLRLAELEEQSANTSREYDKSQKHFEFVKEGMLKKHKEEKQEMEKKFKTEMEESEEEVEIKIHGLIKEHKKELFELKKNINQQLMEAEKNFNKEMSATRESYNRERSELEERLAREKAELRDTLKQEHQHKLAVQVAEVRKIALQEKKDLEKKFNDEKLDISSVSQQDRIEFEKSLQHIKADMEINFAEEKARLEKKWMRENSKIKEEYECSKAELEQMFTEGEAGLKGQLKDDFMAIVENYKDELESSYTREKSELQESFAREQAELELSWQVEKAELEENFDTEKGELEESFKEEKEKLISKFNKQKSRIEEEYKMEIENMKVSRESEFHAKVSRETKQLERTVEHLETELNSLKIQKKELESKIQSLELKHLSQKQERYDIIDFQKERKVIDERIISMEKQTEDLQQQKDDLENEKFDLEQEKATILENSVREITEQQEQIFRLQSEKEALECQTIEAKGLEAEVENIRKVNSKLKKQTEESQKEIFELEKVKETLECQVIEANGLEDEIENVRKENSKLKRQTVESQKEISKLEKLRDDIRNLDNTLKTVEKRKNDLESALQDRHIKLTRAIADNKHMLDKIENMELIHKKELDIQRESLTLANTAFVTEKSRITKELQEVKEQLHRATIAGDRDQALKEKVFNDAKAEVMSLNKKLEEKVRRIKNLENACRLLESHGEDISQAKQDLENQVKQMKETMNENSTRFNKEKSMIETKATRSDNLVQELYLENAELTKQMSQIEGCQRKAEKQVRQLMEQKRALQRVISKLCGANAIA